MIAYINTTAIKAEYAPYHTMEAFETGFENWMAGNRMDGATLFPQGLDQQAYDRGCEAASRCLSKLYWIEQNVGAN